MDWSRMQNFTTRKEEMANWIQAHLQMVRKKDAMNNMIDNNTNMNFMYRHLQVYQRDWKYYESVANRNVIVMHIGYLCPEHDHISHIFVFSQA